MRNLKITLIIISTIALALSGCSKDPINYTCEPEVSEDITESTVWGEACDTITVTKSIRVLAGLTISKSTVVQFAQNANIVVADSGSINAVGTEYNPIQFIGTNPVKGWWGGIAFETQSPRNVFNYVTISDAGAVGYKHNRWVLTIAGNSTSPGKLEISDSKIIHCEGDGLVIRTGGELSWEPHFSTRNHFEDIEGIPVIVAFDALDVIHGTFSFINNRDNFVLVTKGTLDKEILAPPIPIPYRFGHDLDITDQGGLYVGPGTEIEFEQDVQLETNGGVISFEGSEERPILLTGAQKIPDYWGGISYESINDHNQMKNVILEYAGAPVRGNWEFGVFVSGNATTRGSLLMENVHLKDIDGDGVYVRIGGILVEATNVTFENVSGQGIVNEN